MLTLNNTNNFSALQKTNKLLKSQYFKHHLPQFINIAEPFKEINKNKLFLDKTNKNTWLVSKDFYHHVGNKYLSEKEKYDESLPTQITKDVKNNFRISENKKTFAYKLFMKK